MFVCTCSDAQDGTVLGNLWFSIVEINPMIHILWVSSVRRSVGARDKNAMVTLLLTMIHKINHGKEMWFMTYIPYCVWRNNQFPLYFDDFLFFLT